MKNLKTVVLLVGIVLLLVVRYVWFETEGNTAVNNYPVAPASVRPDVRAETAPPPSFTPVSSPATEIFKAAATARDPRENPATRPTKSRTTNDLTRIDDIASTPDRPAQDLVDPQELVGSQFGVMLQAGGLDSRKGRVNIPEDLRFNPASVLPGQTVRYLVQFSGPVQSLWKEEIGTIGGSIGNYIPNNTLVVAMTEQTKEAVSGLPYVQWIDYFHPAYKLATALAKPEVLEKAKRPGRREEKPAGDSAGETAANEDPPSAIPPRKRRPPRISRLLPKPKPCCSWCRPSKTASCPICTSWLKLSTGRWYSNRATRERAGLSWKFRWLRWILPRSPLLRPRR